MSALGQKQTSRHLQPMSALPPKADIGTQSWNVRFTPESGHCGPISTAGFTLRKEVKQQRRGFSGFLKVGGGGNFLKFPQRRDPFLSARSRAGSARPFWLSALQAIRSERAAVSQEHRWIRNAAMKIASAVSNASKPRRVASTNV